MTCMICKGVVLTSAGPFVSNAVEFLTVVMKCSTAVLNRFTQTTLPVNVINIVVLK